MNRLPVEAVDWKNAMPDQTASATFSSHFNRSSFMFDHGLAEHPLLRPERLAELAQRRPQTAEYAYWSNGSIGLDDRWDKNSGAPASLADTIAGIAGNDSLVMLRHVELDWVLGPLVCDLLKRLVGLCGEQLRDDAIVGRASLLLASPHRVTSYHIDGDCNYLLQIRGDKTFLVFNQADRTLLSDEELERYFCGDFNGAQFKQWRIADATTYALGPGRGVHVPCTAPHLARNGDDVSVALSLNFDLRSQERRAGVYRINHRLRRLGLNPATPGSSEWSDGIKIGLARALSGLRTFERGHGASSRLGWSPAAS